LLLRLQHRLLLKLLRHALLLHALLGSHVLRHALDTIVAGLRGPVHRRGTLLHRLLLVLVPRHVLGHNHRVAYIAKVSITS
jgi:hypothetical protein